MRSAGLWRVRMPCVSGRASLMRRLVPRPSQKRGTVSAKHQLRIALLRQLRTQKEEQRRRKSQAVIRKLLRLAVFRKAKTVLCYVSLSYEVETRRLLERMLAQGKRVVVPRVQGRKLFLSAIRDPDSDLAPGAFGVLEPASEAMPPVPLRQLDLVVVPGLAFYHRGHRLGHGFGYFDGLLTRLPKRIPSIGLCFDFQLLEHLPTHTHDRPVQAVICA